MRRIIFFLFTVTLLGIVSARAQSLTLAARGDKAFLFDFAGFDLNGYMGGIGGKYFLLDQLAFRGMLQFGIDNHTMNTNPETTDNTIGFGIGAALEYHLPLSSSVSPYLGGGLSFTMTTNKQNQYAETKTTDLGFGVGVLAGVEYFFNQNLSLAGEYQFGFSASSTKETGLVNRSTLQLGFQSAGLTLAVYF